MSQTDKEAQQIACNTASAMHASGCIRRKRPAGELFNSSAIACSCWVVVQVREDIRRKYGE